MPIAPLRTRPVEILTLHVPVAAETLRSLATGDHACIDGEPALSAILAIVREANPLGDFGVYRSVVELGLGWELFTPAGSARPTLGVADTESRSPTVILRIHLPAEDRALADAAITRILAAHPWETPVIERSTADLLIR
ncbi:hypothetical protein [Sphingomonas sp. R1]|uniref:hypothetical protein n=1 Tax=Sphingomonas sp. R1 TaxID=399176 RepID=UPI0022243998|nr:hypothetical protein [Sphingomonas sp. R1]UYY76391.1 hypothetical protein OIM94_12775 [Sphingomonas sp. R1]